MYIFILMYIYLLEYNNNIIGVYNDFNLLTINIKSLYQNNFIVDDVVIKTYYSNSGLLCNNEKCNNKNLDNYINKINNDIENKNIENSFNNMLNKNFKVNYNNNLGSRNNENNMLKKNVENVFNNNNLSQTDNIITYNNDINNNDNNNVEAYNNDNNIVAYNEILKDEQTIIDSNVHKKVTFDFNKIAKEFNKDLNLDKLNKKDNTKLNNIITTQKNKINEQINLQHNINLLKNHKEKIKESKSIYENDLKLYYLFESNKKSDSNFIIPELFEDKYNLFNKLVNENNLSWENFIKVHNSELFNYNVDKHIIKDTVNINEKKVPCNDKLEINEELDIESDSDTEKSK